MSGYGELRSATAFIDLSTRGKLSLTGEDRARLLHAMCTNDVEHLETGAGVYAFFLSSQGRILAETNIFNRGSSLFVDTEPEAAASLAAHLDKYIIADDVTIEDLTGNWVAIALEGPSFETAAARAEIPVPSEALAVKDFDKGFSARVASAATDGLRIVVPMADKAGIVECLKVAGVSEATFEEANIVRLENKRPRYGVDFSDRNLVHETQQLQGVHFNKGCYIGQEIVERVRSQGKVHRLLTPIAITGQTPPTPGTKIHVSGKGAGEITSAAWSPALGQVVGFAYLRGEALHPANRLEIEINSIAEQASVRL